MPLITDILAAGTITPAKLEGSWEESPKHYDSIILPPTPVGRRLGAQFGSGGYGDWKYRSDQMRKKVERLAEHLPAFMQRFDADFIAVRGTSGTFIAGALLVALDVQVMMMRKKGEKCHGDEIEGRYSHSYRRGIILDDFVCTGATARGMIEDLKPYPCEFVAILEHSYAHESGDMHIAEKKREDDGGYNFVEGLDVYKFSKRK